MENVADLVNEHPFDLELQSMFLKFTKETRGTGETNNMRSLSFQFVDFSDAQWIEWIEDSKIGGVSLIVDVISKAFEYHPSPSVLVACVDALPDIIASDWNEWLIFPSRPTSVKSAIRFMEQALDKVSLWPESKTLWESARKFLMSFGGDKEAVRKLFVRQLQAVPMKVENIDTLKKELEQYEQEASLSHLQVDTSKSEKMWKSWSSMELKVHDDPSVWSEMIQKRSSIDPPEYVASLYARAVIFDPRNEHHWVQYSELKENHKVKSLCLQRGVKNCPYSGKLWAELIKQAAPLDSLERFLMLGVSALRDSLHIKGNAEFLSDLLLYDAQLKIQQEQSPRESFQTAISILSEVSPSLSVGALIAWLHYESFQEQDEESPLSLISEFIDSEEWDEKRKACTPLQWVQLAWIARQSSDPLSCRKIYKAAIHLVEDKFKPIIFQDWTLFERSFGTIQSVAELTRTNLEVQSLLLKEPKRKAETSEKIERKKPKAEIEVTRKPQNPFPTCVFVKDLPFSATEETVSQFFQDQCHISKPLKVLLVTNHIGKSRGFGYAEFEFAEQADKAISCSGTILDGRALNITASTRAITVKRDNRVPVQAPEKLEEEKERTNDYFRSLVLQKKKHSEQ